MSRQIVSIESVTPTGGNDVMTFVSASGKRFRFISLTIGGRGTSSAAQNLMLGRSTGGTTPGGALSGGKYSDTDSDALQTSVYTSWTAQPTLGAGAEALAVNAMGAANRLATPGGFFESRNGEQVSLRASTGITWQAISVSAVIEEDY
jgi:hypothetical protein